MNAQIDVRHALTSIRVPTLVIHRTTDARVKFAAGRQLAQKISSARFVEIPGRDHPIWTGDIDAVVDRIEEFLTGEPPAPSHDHVLATLVVARLADATRPVAFTGDRLWNERLSRLQQSAADTITRHSGRPLGPGKELGARFDGTVRAVRCAIALRDVAAASAFSLAIGVHAGEIAVRGDAITGRSVNIAEQIATLAAGGEILASAIVKDLVSGSGLRFVERSNQVIDDGDNRLRLLAVMAEQHLAPVRCAARTPGLEILSDREREVLKLVADGLSNAGIAKQLMLSDHTVKRHVANILLKLDLPTRAAAAALIGRDR
jgi:DNA-binding NarL/FixJ family response regulator